MTWKLLELLISPSANRGGEIENYARAAMNPFALTARTSIICSGMRRVSMQSRYAQLADFVNNLSKIFSNRPENSIIPFFRRATEAPFHFLLAVVIFIYTTQLLICYPRRMTAQIIQFPARPVPSISTPLPAIDAWIDDVDAEGSDIPPLRAQMLLRRCPDPDHEVAQWLASQIPASARITNDAG